MKTTVLKSVMPMFVVAIGLAGALSNSAIAKEAKSGSVQGWKHGVKPCEAFDMCENQGGPICTVGSVVLYELLPNGTCPNPLTRI